MPIAAQSHNPLIPPAPIAPGETPDAAWCRGLDGGGEGIAAGLAQALEVKIRYRATPVPATVRPLADDRAEVCFTEPVKGATSGQGAVFYAGDRCLGGGLVLGFLLSTIYGAVFHLIIGGPPRRLLLYVAASWIGFAVGHLIGDLLGIELLKLGAIHLLAASIGSWVALILSWFLSARNTG